jgi:hypothetical protein
MTTESAAQTEGDSAPSNTKRRRLDDVVTFALGSEVFEIERELLQAFPESMLAKLVASDLARVDASGAFMISHDVEPNVFRAVLSVYLEKLRLPVGFGVPRDAAVHPVALCAALDYFGLPFSGFATRRPGTPLSVLAAQARLDRGLVLAQQLACAVRALGASPGMLTHGALAPSGTGVRFLVELLHCQPPGCPSIQESAGGGCNAFDRELFCDVLARPAVRDEICRRFFGDGARTDDIRALSATPATASEVAAHLSTPRPLVLQPRLCATQTNKWWRLTEHERFTYGGSYKPAAPVLGMFAIPILFSSLTSSYNALARGTVRVTTTSGFDVVIEIRVEKIRDEATIERLRANQRFSLRMRDNAGVPVRITAELSLPFPAAGTTLDLPAVAIQAKHFHYNGDDTHQARQDENDDIEAEEAALAPDWPDVYDDDEQFMAQHAIRTCFFAGMTRYASLSKLVPGSENPGRMPPSGLAFVDPDGGDPQLLEPDWPWFDEVGQNLGVAALVAAPACRVWPIEFGSDDDALGGGVILDFPTDNTRTMRRAAAADTRRKAASSKAASSLELGPANCRGFVSLVFSIRELDGAAEFPAFAKKAKAPSGPDGGFAWLEIGTSSAVEAPSEE